MIINKNLEKVKPVYIPKLNNEIFNIIKKIMKEYKIGKITIVKKNLNEKLNDILNKNNFISDEIISFCNSKKLFHYQINISNHQVYYFSHKTPDKKLIQKFAFIFYVMSQLANSLIPIHFTFIDCSIKKEFPQNNIFSPNNVNSGACIPSKYVYVWRNEDVTKVLVHELIHFYKFDIPEIKESYINLFPNIIVEKEYTPEFFTESFTIILHSIIISQFIPIKLETILFYELNYSYHQYLRIVKLNFKQTTSVRSYYLIKFLLIYNTEKFLQYLDMYIQTQNHNINYLLEIIYDSYNKIQKDSMIDMNKISNIKSLRLNLF